MRADQHKCLPHLACINPKPLLFLKNYISKFEKKSFHKFVEHVETNLLINNTLHFDQYPRLAICSNIFVFVFWPIIWKRIRNLKK